MKSTKTLLSCIVMCMTLFSCTQNEESHPGQVIFSVDDFVVEGNTKTNCDPANDYDITWASGDTIGIFSIEDFQELFVIPANQVGESSATFDGGHLGVKNGKTYYAYYPFSVENFKSAESKTKIHVAYTGQSQTGTQCDAVAYDYTFSDWKAATDGDASFQFHHVGALLVLRLPLPDDATYNKLTIMADGEVIPTEGTYDLAAAKEGNPAFVPTDKSSSLSMELKDFTGTAGDVSVFYMMLPPCDLSSSTLTVELTNSADTSCYFIESKNITAGTLYIVNGHGYVDLGLSSGTLWATCNMGASKPEDYGDYFAWGETTSYNSGKKDFGWNTYKWCKGSYTTMTKYCTSSSYGTVDNKTELDLADDVARANWGGSWRMPSSAQIDELIRECKTRWNDDKAGLYFYSRRGYRRMFLPAAGYFSGSTLYEAGETADYWSSSLSKGDQFENGTRYGSELTFSINDIYRDGHIRCIGQSVRPVINR